MIWSPDAKQIVLLSDVLAEKRTYPTPIFAIAAMSVRMMRSHRTTTKTIDTTVVMIRGNSRFSGKKSSPGASQIRAYHHLVINDRTTFFFFFNKHF